MQILKYPPRNQWPSYCKRPSLQDEKIRSSVKEIVQEVKTHGDIALKKFSQQFDSSVISDFICKVPEGSIPISPGLKDAIKRASANIKKYHATQVFSRNGTITTPGVECWWEKRPIETAGLYIPGGSSSLFSTLLMLAVPAQLAGCKNLVVCTPPSGSRETDQTLLYVAQILDIPLLYEIGGAQAIAAMAYGTESIPQVDKIFGPGNQYVTVAKQLLQQENIAIDMPAGPSELLVIADESGDPAFIAADLLSQAEHGPDSQVVFLSTSPRLIDQVMAEVKNQKSVLPRISIVEKSLQNSKCILFSTFKECLDFSNLFAPEHLILAFEKAEKYTSYIQHAGSVFIGPYACESAGDYISGTNHTLPTSGYARMYGGISIDSFQKNLSFQKLSKKGLQNLGPAIMEMARAEGLEAHAQAVAKRLNA